MIDLIEHLRRLGRRRIERQRLQRQLIELRAKKTMLEADLGKMHHWSPEVQQRMQEQIYAVTKRIIVVEKAMNHVTH